MKTFFYFFIFITSALYSIPKNIDSRVVNVNNAILAKVNEKTISVIDVKEKMDILFHKAYPKLQGSLEAKFQFYKTGWRDTLSHMINTELLVKEAEKKEIKVTDSEVREEMIKQFGTNIMQTIDKIGLSYEKAWKITKEDMIVQRMNWFFIHMKALNKVTPESIKKNYRLHLEENPALDKWQYQVISIKTPNEKLGTVIADQAHGILSTHIQNPKLVKEQLKDLENQNKNLQIKISDLYEGDSKKISTTHKEVLLSLSKDSISAPIKQISRFTKKPIFRIFYLKDHSIINPPSFEDLAPKIKEKLFQKAYSEESQDYFSRLKKHYGFDEQLDSFTDDLDPFVLE